MSQQNAAQAGLDVRTIAISRIVRSEHFQIRLALNEGAVRHYMKMYELGTQPPLPPVDVAEVDGVLVLVDGFHRVRALELLGRLDVEVTMRPLPSLAEAQWQGAAINGRHGVPLNAKERRRAFKAWIVAEHYYLDGKPHDKRWQNMKSFREIGVEFSLSHTHVSRLIAWASPRLHVEMSKRGQSQLDRPEQRGQKGPIKSVKLSPAELVSRNLQSARAAYAGVADPVERGALIEQSEDVTRAMRSNTTSFAVLDF